MVTVLVTGTNQGIGFGIVQQLAKRSDVSQIFATVRDPTSSASAEVVELAKTTKNLHVIKMVLKEDAIAAAAEEVKKLLNGKGLDILINNIGIGQGYQRPHEVSADMLREQFEVNVIGPQLVTKAFIPLLEAGEKKIIINISSIAGSITYNDGRNPWLVPAYGSSKAALNFLTREWAKDLKPEGFTIIALYPGYVKTRAAPYATMTTEEAGKAILENVVFKVTPKDTGSFLDYEGNSHPW